MNWAKEINKIQEEEETMNHLQVLLSAILSKYFEHFYCVFLISDGGFDFQLDGGVKLVAFETAKLPEIDLQLACQGFVVHSRGQILTTLSYLEEQVVKDEAGIFYDRRYLLISPSEGNGKEIFGAAFLENVRDVLLVTTSNGSFFELWTHKFVSKDCGDPILLDLWFPNNGSFLGNSDLYPDKTSDLGGKILRLSSFSYTPYNFVGDSFEESKGIEISLLAEFARRKNLTVLLKDSTLEKWGRIFKNGTGVGMIGDVKKFRSDLACGSFLQSQAVIPRVDFTFPTMKIRITCLVPKPKLIVAWTIPFTQFSLGLWGLLGVFLTLSSLILVLLDHLERKTLVSTRQKAKTTFARALFCTCRATLSQASAAEDHFQRFKGIFIFIFLLSLVITTSYDSTLASRMTVPRYENVIDTAKDLAESGLAWGGRNKREWTGALAKDTREEYRKIRKSFVEKNESELLKLGHAGVFGFPIDKLPSGYFAIQSNIDEATLEKLRPMRHELYSGLSVIFAKKNYILLPSLNDHILRVYQSGLLHFWELEGVMLLRFRFQNLLKYSEEKHENTALNWSHVKGIFVLWSVGIVASISAFVYEVLKGNETKRKSIQL